MPGNGRSGHYCLVMRPDQLPLLISVSAPALHPDGSWAVVSTSRPDFDADGYVGQLWRVPLDGSGPRRLTRGQQDSRPRFSPDGTLLGFLRHGADGRPQVHLIPSAGGEAVCVTNQPLGVSDFVFSPDGGTLAFIARVPADGRYGTLDGVDAAHEDPRQVTTLAFQANGLGWSRDRRNQLFLTDVPDVFGEPPVPPVGRAAQGLSADALRAHGVPAARQLTSADTDHHAPCFTADGNAVLVAAGRTDEPENLIDDLLRVPVDGAETSRLTAGPLSVGSAVLVGDAVWFTAADLGESGLEYVAAQPGVYRLGADGPERLTPEELLVTGELAPAGDGVLAITDHRGASQLLRVSDGGVEVLIDGGVLLTGVAASADRVVASYRDATSFGEVGVLESGQPVTAVTDFGAALREAVEIRPSQELIATAPDGYPVHGWVVTPAGEGPHPVLLMIHGGPFSQYTLAFFDEAQVYAEAGYAVVMCNPRGSAGYGPQHGRAIQGAFGSLDTSDVLAFLTHAMARVPGLDSARVGIMGGSYGGYLTAWIIAHHHRWAGAIVERGYLDPASFVGSSDIGWYFPQQYNGSKEQMDAQSPMLLTDRVSTPTFVIHSEQDLRCPLSQGLRYYAQLKQAGVDAELLVFPGENHELSRSGTPWHRRQRFEAILDWWARHLPA